MRKHKVPIMSEEILAEQIANQLRRNILRGKLLPGAAVKERDNATEMGVSRTPLREAIRILAKEGLIELRPARSPIVSQPSLKQVSDDVEVLLAVEILSGELACVRATDDEITGIADIQSTLVARFDKVDPLDLFEIDMSFHRAIALAAHNAPLADIHQTFLGRLWRGRFLAAVQRRNRERVVAHHNEIVAALQNRDPVAIRAAILVHMENLQRDIVGAVSEDIKGAATDDT